MDPSLQDHVLIPDNFFEYIYHIGCYFNMHSVVELGLIVGGKKMPAWIDKRYSSQP